MNRVAIRPSHTQQDHQRQSNYYFINQYKGSFIINASDRGQFNVIQPNTPCQFRLMQAKHGSMQFNILPDILRQFMLILEEQGDTSNNRHFLTCDKKFLIHVVTDHNNYKKKTKKYSP